MRDECAATPAPAAPGGALLRGDSWVFPVSGLRGGREEREKAGEAPQPTAGGRAACGRRPRLLLSSSQGGLTGMAQIMKTTSNADAAAAAEVGRGAGGGMRFAGG